MECKFRSDMCNSHSKNFALNWYNCRFYPMWIFGTLLLRIKLSTGIKLISFTLYAVCSPNWIENKLKSEQKKIKRSNLQTFQSTQFIGMSSGECWPFVSPHYCGEIRKAEWKRVTLRVCILNGLNGEQLMTNITSKSSSCRNAIRNRHEFYIIPFAELTAHYVHV